MASVPDYRLRNPWGFFEGIELGAMVADPSLADIMIQQIYLAHCRLFTPRETACTTDDLGLVAANPQVGDRPDLDAVIAANVASNPWKILTWLRSTANNLGINQYPLQKGAIFPPDTNAYRDGLRAYVDYMGDAISGDHGETGGVIVENEVVALTPYENHYWNANNDDPYDNLDQYFDLCALAKTSLTSDGYDVPIMDSGVQGPNIHKGMVRYEYNKALALTGPAQLEQLMKTRRLINACAPAIGRMILTLDDMETAIAEITPSADLVDYYFTNVGPIVDGIQMHNYCDCDYRSTTQSCKDSERECLIAKMEYIQTLSGHTIINDMEFGFYRPRREPVRWRMELYDELGVNARVVFSAKTNATWPLYDGDTTDFSPLGIQWDCTVRHLLGV